MKKLLVILCICANSPIFSMLNFLKRPSINMHQQRAKCAVVILKCELSKETNHISNNEIIRVVRLLQKVDFSKLDEETTITVAATLKKVDEYAKNNPIINPILTPIITSTLMAIIEIIPVTILKALGFWPEGVLCQAGIINAIVTYSTSKKFISEYKAKNKIHEDLKAFGLNN